MIKILIAVLLIFSCSNLSFAQDIDLNFNNENSIKTLELNNKLEPLIPSASQMGPDFVASGRPFFADHSEGLDVTGFTVAPGTQYVAGFESTCMKQDTQECIRDNALYIQLRSNSETVVSNSQDKAMFRVKKKKDNDIFLSSDGRTSRAKFLSFDVKFDKFYEKTHNWTLINQIYQPGCGPALSVQMERAIKSENNIPTHERDIAMTIIGLKDKPYENFQNKPSNKHTSVNDYEVIDMCDPISVERDKWYNVVLAMKPGHGEYFKKSDPNRPIPNGVVQVFINNEVKCTYKGNWGIQKRAKTGKKCEPGSVVDVGVYRARHKSNQGISFDNVRYSNQKEFVKNGLKRDSIK